MCESACGRYFCSSSRRIHTRWVSAVLEHVLCGNLEEPGIRVVILELLSRSDITACVVQSCVGRIIPRGMIEKVEGIRPQLYVLLAPGFEVLEPGHIDTLKSRSINLV